MHSPFIRYSHGQLLKIADRSLTVLKNWLKDMYKLMTAQLASIFNVDGRAEQKNNCAFLCASDLIWIEPKLKYERLSIHSMSTFLRFS